MRAEAGAVLPGATAREAMRHLDLHGEAVEGTEAVRLRLQGWMDGAIDALDGAYFELPPPVRVVEAAIAPTGTGSAAYYTPPSVDFSRPGRTWLPTQGRARFPLWSLRSVWHHEGVPGHHLQLAQWRYLGTRLSTYQSALASIDACTEGWAMYAERLMDELGHLRTPVSASASWTGRCCVPCGSWSTSVCTCPSRSRRTPRSPRDRPGPPGSRGSSLPSTADSPPSSSTARSVATSACLARRSRTSSERRPGWTAGPRPGGTRVAWGQLDLKSWHTAALSLGPLGLDDLQDELARL